MAPKFLKLQIPKEWTDKASLTVTAFVRADKLIAIAPQRLQIGGAQGAGGQVMPIYRDTTGVWIEGGVNFQCIDSIEAVRAEYDKLMGTISI